MIPTERTGALHTGRPRRNLPSLAGWYNTVPTCGGGFELVLDSLRGAVPNFESDGGIQYNNTVPTCGGGFELVLDSLRGAVPNFESDGGIQYKIGCNHLSLHCWQWELSFFHGNKKFQMKPTNFGNKHWLS
jgi:hypothetical protein